MNPDPTDASTDASARRAAVLDTQHASARLRDAWIAAESLAAVASRADRDHPRAVAVARFTAAVKRLHDAGDAAHAATFQTEDLAEYARATVAMNAAADALTALIYHLTPVLLPRPSGAASEAASEAIGLTYPADDDPADRRVFPASPEAFAAMEAMLAAPPDPAAVAKLRDAAAHASVFGKPFTLDPERGHTG